MIKTHLDEALIGHLSRDGTAIAARERPVRAQAVAATPAKRRGRPRRDEVRTAAKESPLKRQRKQTLAQMLLEIPTACERGTQCNAQGYKVSCKCSTNPILPVLARL